jgi:hypothetical protein
VPRQPKRSDQRHGHRTRAEIAAAAPTKAAARVETCGPEPPVDLGEQGQRFFQSLRTSGQSVYYTDSDWETAALLSFAVQKFYDRPSAMLLSSIHQMLGALAVTEGERRKLRLELSNDVDENDPDEVAALTMIAGYRREAG